MTFDEIESKKQNFLLKWQNVVDDVCYYDRKDDPDVTQDDVDFLIDAGHVTLENILFSVKSELLKNYPTIKNESQPGAEGCLCGGKGCHRCLNILGERR